MHLSLSLKAPKPSKYNQYQVLQAAQKKLYLRLDKTHAQL
jgi:hypothetical protein